MPFTIQIEADRGIAIAKGSGPFDLEDARAGLEAVVTHPRFAEGVRLLWDVRERTTAPDPQGAKAWLDTLTTYREHLDHRIAVLTRAGAQYGIGRMVEIHAELRNFELRVFVDPASAEDWLRGEP